MIIDTHKYKIRQCFNRAAETYDEYCHVQYHAGQKLLQMMTEHMSEHHHIVDLGCGTGLMTEQLLEKFQDRHFYAIDIADQLLIRARARLSKNVVFITDDFDNLSHYETLYDVMFSNMSLQWSLNLSKTLAVIANNLRDNGLLAFSLPLAGTFAELTHINKNDFYTGEMIRGLIQQLDFHMLDEEVESYVSQYDSFYHACKSIKNVGANYTFTKNMTYTKKNLFTKEPIMLTYKIGYFVARKP